MKKFSSNIIKIILLIIALIWLVITVYPLIFSFQTSFKSSSEFLMGSPLSIPESLNIENFITVLTEGGFYRFFLNSVIITVISVGIILLASSLLGFALAKRDIKYKNIIYLLFLAGLYVPITITLIPDYKITQALGLYDTLWGLIGPLIAICLPVSILIMTRFMNEIPDETIEAAKIDGCSWLGIYWRIGLPLNLPALSTIGIWSSILVWNEFIYPLILVSSTENRPLPLAIWRFQGEYNMNVPVIFAFIVLGILPLLILYTFLSDKVIKGMAMHGDVNK